MKKINYWAIHQINHHLGKKHWVKINYDSRGTYKTNSQFKFKTIILLSSLSDYSDRYILLKGIITIKGEGDDTKGTQTVERNKETIFKTLCPIHWLQ